MKNSPVGWKRHKGFLETGLELVLEGQAERGKALKAGGTASTKTRRWGINKACWGMAKAGQRACLAEEQG